MFKLVIIIIKPPRSGGFIVSGGVFLGSRGSGVGGVLLVLWAPGLEDALPVHTVLVAAAITTAIAGVQYVTRGLQWYQARPAT